MKPETLPIEIRAVRFPNCGPCPKAEEWRRRVSDSKKRVIAELALMPEVLGSMGYRAGEAYFARQDEVGADGMDLARQHQVLYEEAFDVQQTCERNEAQTSYDADGETAIHCGFDGAEYKVGEARLG